MRARDESYPNMAHAAYYYILEMVPLKMQQWQSYRIVQLFGVKFDAAYVVPLQRWGARIFKPLYLQKEWE